MNLVLITGVIPNGLGATIAKNLARSSPALLILTGRDIRRTDIVAKEMATEYSQVNTRILELDISSFESVTRATVEVLAYSEPGIDILFNNAGVMNVPERILSVDKVEMQLATNYLGLFLFTNTIMAKLMRVKGRIVNIVSNGHELSPFRFSDHNFDSDGNNLPEDE